MRPTLIVSIKLYGRIVKINIFSVDYDSNFTLSFSMYYTIQLRNTM